MTLRWIGKDGEWIKVYPIVEGTQRVITRQGRTLPIERALELLPPDDLVPSPRQNPHLISGSSCFVVLNRADW